MFLLSCCPLVCNFRYVHVLCLSLIVLVPKIHVMPSPPPQLSMNYLHSSFVFHLTLPTVGAGRSLTSLVWYASKYMYLVCFPYLFPPFCSFVFFSLRFSSFSLFQCIRGLLGCVWRAYRIQYDGICGIASSTAVVVIPFLH